MRHETGVPDHPETRPVTGAETDAVTGADAAAETGADGLLPPAERELGARRLDQAVQTFVDSPRQAMLLADRAFNEVTEQLAAAIAERGRALRSGWDGEGPPTGETEELRLLLRQYRETTERLLRL
ncbi:hypothetical protein ACTWP5_05685 [Streptomyces sp. 4N509B]|uniref:hypothetical protein n=1 Tax=Streptomyces sp. 4N509B TaxID=3457413 RepID=UPI003FD3F50C